MEKLAWHNDRRKVSDLIPMPENPRRLTTAQEKDLTKSMEKFGFVEVPAINTDNKIIAGHQRLKIAAILGENEVDVRVPNRTMTHDECLEYNLRSNKNTGEFVDELLGKYFTAEMMKEVGFDEDEIAKALGKAMTGEEDDFDTTPPEEPKTRLGDIYELGEHRLVCGDATKREDVEKLMQIGEKADLFLTDPPYGVSYTKKNIAVNGNVAPKSQGTNEIENDELSLDEIKPVWFSAAKNAHDFCSNESAYYWFACQGGDQMMMMMMMMIGDAGWLVRHELIWVKDSMVFGRCDYHYQHEPIIYGWKKKGKHNWYSDRTQTSILQFARPKKSELHPTTKPIELVAYLMGNNSKVDDLVLDLFGGSGTTLIACEQTGRKCRMLELSEKYCDVIVSRWCKLTGIYDVVKNGEPYQWESPVELI